MLRIGSNSLAKEIVGLGWQNGGKCNLQIKTYFAFALKLLIM